MAISSEGWELTGTGLWSRQWRALVLAALNTRNVQTYFVI
jgi:hypothetical protein